MDEATVEFLKLAQSKQEYIGNSDMVPVPDSNIWANDCMLVENSE